MKRSNSKPVASANLKSLIIAKRYLIPICAVLWLSMLAPQMSFAQTTHSDAAEASAMLEIGETSVIGRPRVSAKNIPKLSKNSQKPDSDGYLYSRDEPVYFYPYTSKLAALMKQHGNSPEQLLPALESSSSAARAYFAVALTDQNGHFTVRGLKAGRYVMLTAIPYEVSYSVVAKTGETQTTITGGLAFGFSAVTEPIYRRSTATQKSRRIVFKMIEVAPGKSVIDLGDIE